MFNPSQVILSACASSTLIPPFDSVSICSDIRSALPSDPAFPTFHSALDPNGFYHQQGRIYVPDTPDLRLRILQHCHDHPLSRHFGQTKTLDLIRREYVWPNMRRFIQDYVKSCTVCARSKSTHHKPYGILQQLPIPEKPWNSLSMDFIEHLPLSAGFTSILVIVDRFSKLAIFIPTYDTISAPDLA